MPEMRNGVISEPAPTPVRPTRKPTTKPPKMMMGQAPECRNSIEVRLVIAFRGASGGDHIRYLGWFNRRKPALPLRAPRRLPSGKGHDDGAQAQDGHDAADDDHQDLVGQHFCRVGREWRGDDAADDEAGDDRPQLQADRCDERRRDRQRDEELGEVDRADGVARRRALADERRGDDRTPAAAADGIEQATDEPERRDARRLGAFRDAPGQRLPDDQKPDEQQIRADERLDLVAVAGW